MGKVKLIRASELAPGKMMGIDVRGKKLLLVNLGGKFYAMDGICSHAGGHLYEGKLMGTVVKCPKHGSEFEITTGKNVKGPWIPFGKAYDLRAYPVALEGEDVLVDIP